MDYHLLGRTGLRVSPLALGTMTFGTDWGWGADRDTARAIFDRYVEAGGNLFDTADLYLNGTSETWLGEFIAERGMRDKAVIATKFGYAAEPGNPNSGGMGRKNILRAVEGSLKRLGTDYIDLYILHSWDRFTPIEEVMRTMDDLVRAGKIRHVGLSNVPAWVASRAQTLADWRGWEPVSALQMEYSLISRGIEHEYVDLGRETGAGILTWSPMAGGLLTGKYRSGAAGRLEVMKDTTNPAFAKLTPRNQRIVAEVERVAQELDRSMPQVALNWVMNRPGVASVILGATKEAQIADNIGALNFTIPAEHLASLDAVSALEPSYPYTFFEPELQAGLTGGVRIGDKPAGYAPARVTEGAFAHPS